MIAIINDGPAIASTTYFESEYALQGMFYLSWNAGCARLLVPDLQVVGIPDMIAADHVVISSGPWVEQDNRPAIELLFEDKSPTPFVIMLVADQSDRRLPASDQEKEFSLVLWTKLGEQGTLRAKYRIVKKIPCMEPWHAR